MCFPCGSCLVPTIQWNLAELPLLCGEGERQMGAVGSIRLTMVPRPGVSTAVFSSIFAKVAQLVQFFSGYV